MNPIPDTSRLLEDVFAEGSGEDFRASLLADTLHRARRRRSVRTLRNAAFAAAILGAVGFLGWLQLSPEPAHVPASARGYTLVATHPLPRASIVTTIPFEAGGHAASLSALTVVRTAPGGFKAIDDEALIALLSPRPFILVGAGPSMEKIVFVNKADQLGLLAN